MAGRYKAYAEYKNSGVKWLGNIPTHWNVSKLKRYCQVTDGSHHSPKIEVDGKPFVSVTDVGENSINFESSKKISVDNYVRLVREGCKPKIGDVLLTKDGTIGRACIVKKDMPDFVILSSLGLLTPSKLVSETYLYYYLVSGINIDQMNSLIHGSALRRMTISKIYDLVFCFPEKQEQQKIANFLDHETAKIDTLIAKQEMLIELLKEKRQAVISHAVTKGLNPDAPMKDSGVEWLGEVPEHWDVTKFGYISQVVRGGSPRPAGDPELFNGDYSPWVTVAEITKDDEIYLTETETFLTKKGSLQCRVFTAGTLLLSNSGATLGVPSILSINANANDGVVGFENLKVNSEFAYFYLSSLTQGLRDRIKQGSGQPNLNTDIVKSISIPLPPSDEIEKIVEYIHKLRAHYRQLESKAIHGITLLKERKTALISAAVTGKIDVRDWEPQGVQDE
ncbi:restriction endonuclease subunit S [Vibrio cholerae]